MHCSNLVLIFLASILLMFSTPRADSTLIKQICDATRRDFGVQSCDRVLQSERRVVAAKNLFDLSVAIIKSGMSTSKHTRRHIKRMLERNTTDPDTTSGIKDCKSSYDWAVGTLGGALGEVLQGEYQTASYDLLLSGTDCIRSCEQAVASKVVRDKIIKRGNKLVTVFGLSAYEAVDRLP